MKKTTFILLCFFGLAGIVLHGQAKAEFTDTPYPVAVKYLPPPPDSLSMAFAYDVHQYMYHKSLRETERGQQALTDVSYGGNAISQRMQDIFGLPPASVDYPTIRKWFVNSLDYIALPCGAAKTYYNRRRPFDRFNEPLFSNESPASLRLQGSYPSAHAMLGWAGALLLSEINPKLQDDLYDSGYEYGQSRLIIGAHWQSDVDAARLMTSATFARLHANEEFLALLDLVQAKYDSVTQNTRPTALDQLHPMVYFLPEMPDSAGAAFANDVTAFYKNKSLRSGNRGIQAQNDADMTVAGISKAFYPLLGMNISASSTPNIYRLVETAITQARDNCLLLQNENHRTPPYLRLREQAMPGTQSISESSYPSCHATVGWISALVLMDVCPTKQNDILNRGREYGQSRVIAGTNWQSDVDAGQLLGGMVFTSLASDHAFRDLITQARQEFNQLSEISQVQADAESAVSSAYTLDGRCATSESRGIIIYSDGHKELQ